MSEYPHRKPFYAHKLVRLMMKVCAAQDIGSDAFMLVTCIAHTEDARQYRGPVTWWNDQLQSILGFSWSRLNRSRNKAIEAGWLHYEAGGKSKVGKYWTTVPEAYVGLPDGPCDCDASDVFLSASDEQSGDPNDERNNLDLHQRRDKRGTNGDLSGGQAGDKRRSFYPNPNPNPNPKEDSSEPDKPASEPEPAFVVFPVVGKGPSEWPLTETMVSEFAELYPALDVRQEFRSALAWVKANNRKTARGMRSFLTNWLNRSVKAGGARASPSQAPKRKFDIRKALGDDDGKD